MRNRCWLWIERLLLTVGALLVTGYAVVVLEARAFSARQERRLEQGLSAARSSRAGPAAAKVPKRKPAGAWPALAPQDLVGRIEIPRLKLRAIVAEGVSARTLRLAVGHLPGSALPGEAGNVVLAAHRDTFFRPLEDVQPGDAVVLTTTEGRFAYSVEATDVVEPSRTDLLAPGTEPALTLVTCYPFDAVLPGGPLRYVVRAVAVLPEGNRPDLY